MSSRVTASDMVASMRDPTLKLATTPPPKPPDPKTSFGALCARNSKISVQPTLIRSLVDKLSQTKEKILELGDFALPGFDDAAQVVYHPTFIRAAARYGLVYYVDSMSKIRCASVEGGPIRADSPMGDADENFFLSLPWHRPLSKFVAQGASVLLIGPPGTGKSLACEKLFEHRLQGLEVLSCRPDIEAQDIFGRTEIKSVDGSPETYFMPSPILGAIRFGRGLLLDELDALRPEAAFGLYRVIEGKSLDTQAGVVKAHPDFRVVATQNTEGRGDDKGVMHGRSYQDDAFLDRWDATIRVDYPSVEDEIDIIVRAVGIDNGSALKIVNSAVLLRLAYEDHNLMRCCSMRRTLAIARNVVAGFPFHEAWLYGFINQVVPGDAVTTKAILSRVYGSKINKKALGL